MMDKFSEIFQGIPISDISSYNNYFGVFISFKVKVNFYILVFEGKIDANFLDKGLNMLEGYFYVQIFCKR